MNEVRRYQSGWRIYVLLPGTTRRRLVPPTFDTAKQAHAALDVWNADVEGIELPLCVHDIVRASCATCTDGQGDASFQGNWSDVQVPFSRTDGQAAGPPRQDDHRDTTEQRITAAHAATERRFARD